MVSGCSRFYTLSIFRIEIEKENYAFEVRYVGELKHDVQLSNDEHLTWRYDEENILNIWNRHRRTLIRITDLRKTIYFMDFP